MGYKLVIVESPAKAKTIEKYLPKGCKVQATMGHIIDLPKKDLGVDVENRFEPTYKTIYGKGKIVKEIKDKSKKADEIILATDPDREGEAISWHLANLLGLDLKEKNRIEFHEITKSAINNAMEHKRTVNQALVDAQQARRVLDRLVGYKISPILWRKIMKGLSAGRVQSVATKMVVDRENEINAFKSQEYWVISGLFENGEYAQFEAKLTYYHQNKIELKNQQDADNVLAVLNRGKYQVSAVKQAQKKKNPPNPFTTSTLQQDAYRKLGFSTKRTMMVAQQLYEGVEIKGKGQLGLITYLRTDSVRISDEAQTSCKQYIQKTYGSEYVKGGRSKQKKKGNVQDAHEAIRATDVTLTPEVVKDSLSREQYRLYDLIYRRFVASMMSPSIHDTISADIENSGYVFRATGSKIHFPGFLKVYRPGNADEEEFDMPLLKEGEKVTALKIDANQKFTQPPARYTEASLVKTLEEKGIGRPSTYAPTISTIINRGYVELEEKKFRPTDLGFAVNKLMCENFSNIVNEGFTAQMEEKLDAIAEGGQQWQDAIKDFYEELITDLDKAVNIERIKLPEEETDIVCEKCGRNMVIKRGKFGKFLACPGFPECNNTMPLKQTIDAKCPKCGKDVVQRKSKKGRLFYGCSGYPDCDFVSWDKPTNEKCPDCGGVLYEKKGRKNTLYCANKECGYIQEQEED